MTKRIFILLLVLMLAVSVYVFATGSSESKEGDSGNMKVEKTEDGKIILRFWHIFTDANRKGWIQERADEWNSSQSKYFMIPEAKGNYRETLNASILAVRQGEGPHLVQIFEVGSQLALDSKIFKPVSEVGELDYSDYIDSVLNYYTIEGQVNSIPFNSSSPILYYNKDMMKQAGLDPNDPPKTLEKLIEYSEIAKAKGNDVAGLGFPLHGWFFEQWVAEQGGMLANNGNGRKARATEVELNSPEMKRIATLLKELNDKGLYKYSGKLEDWRGSDNIFTEEKVMFHITSTADAGNIAEAVEGKFELGTGYLPIPEGERNGTVVGGASVWLVDGHSNEDLVAAQDFLIFMTNTENMAGWHKLTGYYPVRKSSIDFLKDEGWFEKYPERTIAFTQLLETKTNEATAGALIGSFLDTRTILGEAMQQVLNDGTSVEKALDEANEKANEKLKEYNQNIQ